MSTSYTVNCPFQPKQSHWCRYKKHYYLERAGSENQEKKRDVCEKQKKKTVCDEIIEYREVGVRHRSSRITFYRALYRNTFKI